MGTYGFAAQVKDKMEKTEHIYEPTGKGQNPKS